jgi:hypothetical protein
MFHWTMAYLTFCSEDAQALSVAKPTVFLFTLPVA